MDVVCNQLSIMGLMMRRNNAMQDSVVEFIQKNTVTK